MKNCLLVLALAFSSGLPLHSQQRPQQGPAKAVVSCEDQSRALASGAYVDAVLDHVWPPAFPVRRGITVAVQIGFGSAHKLFLHTDGSKFELWTSTADVPRNNVWSFLGDLADSCHLPPDPADAVKLLKVQWQVGTLQQAQFEQLHSDFMAALTDYISTVRERSAYFMATKLMTIPLDASEYLIVYDNTWKHFEIEEMDIPVNGKTSPMIKWVREFRGVAESTSHK